MIFGSLGGLDGQRTCLHYSLALAIQPIQLAGIQKGSPIIFIGSIQQEIPGILCIQGSGIFNLRECVL